MNYRVQNIIKSDKNCQKYLRENSHWYKTLNREPEKITDMINEMKERYGLRPTDKISNIVNTFSLISKFMDDE